MGKKEIKNRGTRRSKRRSAPKAQDKPEIEDESLDLYSPEELCLLWEEGHITGSMELLLFQALLSSGWITDLPFFGTKQWQDRLKELKSEGKIKDPDVL